jgi:hypothetical protein
MHIFMDESGTFVTRADGSSLGAVGALVVTESQVEEFERRYAQLRPLLPKHNGEVKGRLMGEADVARVVDVARRSGLLYEVTAVDLLPEHSTAVEEHRQGQCDGLTGHLTDQHQPQLVAQVHALRARLEALAPQLYVQSVATFDLLWRTLQQATLYYSLREPHTLARFRWVIDAKAPNGPTNWEQWWSQIVKPMTQARSLRESFKQFEKGDYSHLAAQEIPIPQYLIEALPHLQGKTGLTLAFAYNEIEFSAAPLPGLEVVDVLTNAVRRGLTGNLGQRGWGAIGGLMIDRPKPTYVHTVGFGHDSRLASDQAAPVLARLGQGGRPMV